MDIALAVFAGACVACLVAAVFATGRSNIRLIRENTIQARVFRKTLVEHDRFVIEGLNANLSTLYTMFKEDHVRRLLGENGLGPYLGPAGTRARQEVEAFAKQFDVTDAEAVAFLRTQIIPQGPAQPGPATVNDAPDAHSRG